MNLDMKRMLLLVVLLAGCVTTQTPKSFEYDKTIAAAVTGEKVIFSGAGELLYDTKGLDGFLQSIASMSPRIIRCAFAITDTTILCFQDSGGKLDLIRKFKIADINLVETEKRGVGRTIVIRRGEFQYATLMFFEQAKTEAAGVWLFKRLAQQAQ